MGISFAEATRYLLAGQPLSWPTFEGHNGGSLKLATAEQRRLFAFLLDQDRSKIVSGDEQLFPGLIAAWKQEGVDPAQEGGIAPIESAGGTWRLERVQASGFGGLTLFGGPLFEMQVNRENWCLHGQNGSGKTSIASAILWALTGRRIREHEGPVDEHGDRATVTTDTGKKLGEWPPIASYPETPEDLSKPAEVWVRLTFSNDEGEAATAYRRLVSRSDAEPIQEATIDARLVAAPQLLETGLLMPARIAAIGFGERSRSLYEAVKLVTGLDELSDIAECCGQITHRGRRFLKFAKEKGIENLKEKFNEGIAKAMGQVTELGLTLPDNLSLGRESLVADLKEAAKEASAKAGHYLATLKSELAPPIDTSTHDGRTVVLNAVAAARAIVNQGTRTILLFEAWTALKVAGDSTEFASLSKAIEEASDQLERALAWHASQKADEKFRLKALAARFFVPPHEHSGFAKCPLCASILSGKDQQLLAAELSDLKKDATEAERRLEDVCRGIEADLMGLLPQELRKHLDLLVKAEPKVAYAAAVLEHLCEEHPFDDVLTGLAERVKSKVSEQQMTLPTFEFPGLELPPLEPEPALLLRKTMHTLYCLSELVTWWREHRVKFREAWSSVIGKTAEDDSYPPESVDGKLHKLEEALSKAHPLDEISKLLLHAASAAEDWTTIRKEQDLREAIAAAVEPLKGLRLLVASETGRSIASLSDRIKQVLDRIHLRERLNYEETSVGKKAVHVGGSFEPGMHIDAALVANSSWLRAILWAFLLALREETIEGLGCNPFPLIVLDDPQTTFDPRNKKRWAAELARLANLEPKMPGAVQLLLTTHERQFYQCLVDVEKLQGEHGLIGGVNKTSRVATIVNAGWLDKAWREASENNDDARARYYISSVRIYCEDLLKFMLRGEDPGISDLTLGQLRERLEGLCEAHVAPFDRRTFRVLINTLVGGGGRPLRLINEAHHKADETIGLAEASEVKEFWDRKLKAQIEAAFAVYDQFESFSGDPRVFPWPTTVTPFPQGYREDVGELTLLKTGIAAAARSDGRAGDGVVTIEEWATPVPIVLSNHEVYQLAAGTLDPVGGVGDLVIVCNHAKVNPRNLVVAAYDDQLLARRYNQVEEHPGVGVLTGQSVDPYALPEPILIASTAVKLRKIVGTLFASQRLPIPPKEATAEVVPLEDATIVQEMLAGSRLFEVQGRSAEPIALGGQFLITRKAVATIEEIRELERHLIIAIDEDGTRYFKRLTCRGDFALLESLNSDGTTPAEILSFSGAQGLPRLAQALEVVGVLFDMPES